MGECIHSATRKARKDYDDNSADWIQEGLLPFQSDFNLSFTEWRAIANLKANNWQIKKGQVYLREYLKHEDITYTFRTLPEISNICVKHHLYFDC